MDRHDIRKKIFVAAFILFALPVVFGEEIYRAGIRLARPDTVTIVQIRPNKILFNQGEQATVKVTLTNTSQTDQTGELVCEQRWDLDESQTLEITSLTLPAGQDTIHEISFNVNPEPFGREFHAEFIQNGNIVDSWSDFYSATDEWMRAHILSGSSTNVIGRHDETVFGTYGNLVHYFATMPSDFGYGAPAESAWLSGQALYAVSKANQQAQIQDWQEKGVKCTGYVNAWYGGQAGFEVVRQHPEWNIWNADGQPQANMIYVGDPPDPMELASPIELSQSQISGWYQGSVNFYDIDAVHYGTQEIINSTDMFNWDGIFYDGHWNIRPGLDYEGQPTDRGEDIEDLAVRNINYNTDTLRAANSHFATWYNFGKGSAEWYEQTFGIYSFSGEEQFAAMAEVPNSCMLLEVTGHTNPSMPESNWAYNYYMLVENRDYVVQQHGSTHDIGFLWWYLAPDEPGPSNWGWIFHNHLGAQFMATQIHPIVLYNPAWRPTLQFMTRYSALLWAEDVKTVSNPESLVQVNSTGDLWWTDTVYKRVSNNYTDYLIHLVQKPEGATAELYDSTPPPLVSGAEVSLNFASCKIQKAWSLIPYDYTDPQLPKKTELSLVPGNDRIYVGIPDFRYYCLVAVRVQNNLISDINKDCVIDFHDFAELAGYWLQCTDPANVDCD